MPWAAVIGAGIGLYTAHKAGKRQDKMYDQQMDLMQEAVGTQKEGLGFAQDNYNQWNDRSTDVYDQMMGEIDSGIDPDYAAIAGDVNASYDSAKGQEKREMARYGIKPTDGAYQNTEREYAINKSAAHSGIRNKARQESAGIKFERLKGINNGLAGMAGSAASQVGNAYSNVGSAYQSMGGTAGSQGDTAGEQGAAGASGWGQAVGGIDWGGIWNSVSKGSDTTSINGRTDSDIRLKDNIQHVGWFGPVKIYTWTWNQIAKRLGIDSPERGVLAQEHLDSGHVTTGPHGYYQVNVAGILNQAETA